MATYMYLNPWENGENGSASSDVDADYYETDTQPGVWA